jgi:hypothetical protein
MGINPGWLTRNGERGDKLPAPLLGYDSIFMYGKPSHVAAFAESVAQSFNDPGSREIVAFVQFEEIGSWQVFPEPMGDHIVVLQGPNDIEQWPDFLRTVHDRVFPEFSSLDLPPNEAREPVDVELSRPRLVSTHIVIGADPRFISYDGLVDVRRQIAGELSGELVNKNVPGGNGGVKYLFKYSDAVTGENDAAKIVFGPIADLENFSRKSVEKHLRDLLDLGSDAGLEEGWKYSDVSNLIVDDRGVVEASEFLNLYRKISARLSTNKGLTVPLKLAQVDQAIADWRSEQGHQLTD